MIGSRNGTLAVGIASAAAVVALLFGLAADRASAATVACGDTLTRDTTLQADLTCSGDGLIIGADRITVDLNGHTVSSSCVSAPCPVTDGIDNGGGYDNVRIVNGVVRYFEHSILLDGARRNTLSGLNLNGGGLDRSGSNAISLTRSDDNVIANSVIMGGDPAVLLSNSDRNTISRSTINGGISIRVGDGLVIRNGSNGNRVSNSDISGSGVGALVLDSRRNVLSQNSISAYAGGLMLSGADDNTISRNILGAPPFSDALGAFGGGSDGNKIERNVVTSSMRVVGDSNSIERNEARAIRIDGDANRIERNSASANGVFDINAILVSGGDRNVVERNRASGSFGEAVIRIEAAATRTMLTRNIATGGQDPYGTGNGDGIEVEAPGTVISRNTANDNQDLGIDAVNGVIDGGGNHASGNGNPLQCVNVVCTP